MDTRKKFLLHDAVAFPIQTTASRYECAKERGMQGQIQYCS